MPEYYNCLDIVYHSKPDGRDIIEDVVDFIIVSVYAKSRKFL